MAATSTTDRNTEVRTRREREAWDDYNQSLRGLTGQEYENAEGESWDRLQTTLREVRGERAPHDAAASANPASPPGADEL